MKPPTGHAICDSCEGRKARRAALDGLTGIAETAERRRIDEESASHAVYYTAEAKYDEHAAARAAHDPHTLTQICIDAPTKHQFDLPSQARGKRDTMKRLDTTERWGFKLEGVIDAGVGMLCYLARHALGGGANLICTVLILTLVNHHEVR